MWLILNTLGASPELGLYEKGAGLQMHYTLPAPLRPSEGLFDLFRQLSHDRPEYIGEVRAVVAGIGPGSFTGIRVGLAAAAGLQLTHGWPVYGISTFEIMAAMAGNGGEMTGCIVSSGKGTYFYTPAFNQPENAAEMDVETLRASWGEGIPPRLVTDDPQLSTLFPALSIQMYDLQDTGNLGRAAELFGIEMTGIPGPLYLSHPVR